MIKHLAIFALLCSTVHGQCLQDSVSDTRPFIGAVLRPAPIDICPYCDDCDTAIFVGIPADTGLIIFMNVMPQRNWRVKIINGCGGMAYVDTCLFQFPYLASVQFAGDWSHGNWMMQICGGALGFVTWKPSDAHGTSVIAPQPLPCGVLPMVEPIQETEAQFQPLFVLDIATNTVITYDQAAKGAIVVDWKRKRKMMKR